MVRSVSPRPGSVAGIRSAAGRAESVSHISRARENYSERNGRQATCRTGATTMIKITWTVTPRTIELMRNKGARVVSVLTTKITILMQQLSSYVATQKLSGQVLNVKSGILRGSIHALPTTIEGTKITGAVEGAGGPAFYGHVHEFGGKSMFEI